MTLVSSLHISSGIYFRVTTVLIHGITGGSQIPKLYLTRDILKRDTSVKSFLQSSFCTRHGNFRGNSHLVKTRARGCVTQKLPNAKFNSRLAAAMMKRAAKAPLPLIGGVIEVVNDAVRKLRSRPRSNLVKTR